MVAPLEQRLVQSQVVQPEAMADALVQQLHTGRSLVDCLIASNALTEEVLLAFFERESGAEGLLTRRLARVHVSPWVLDRISGRLADELSILPLAFDDSTHRLTVALADPADTDVIARVMTSVTGAARPRGVRRIAVLESGIRAAIRKFYFREGDAFTSDGKPRNQHYRCTNCRAWLNGAVVWCPGCYLLLDPSAPDAEAEISVIRVLLGDPLQTQRALTETSGEDTTASRAFIHLQAVLALSHSARLITDALTPFEQFVVSRANGRRTVADIARACGLAEVEAQAVATALVGRSVLAVLSPEAAPAGKQAAAAPAEPRPKDANPDQWDLLAEAVLLEQAGEFDAAITLLTRGLERMSNAPRLYNRLASVLVRRSDHFGALQLLERAAVIDPTSQVIRHNLLQLREMLGMR